MTIRFERDDFGIVRYKDFTRADTFIRDAVIFKLSKQATVKSIYIRCPICGRIGRLRAWSRHEGCVKRFAVVHKCDNSQCSYTACVISQSNPAYDYVMSIYTRYRLNRRRLWEYAVSKMWGYCRSF